VGRGGETSRSSGLTPAELRLVAELRDALQQTASGPERVRGLLARLVTSLRPADELAAVAKAVSDGVRAVLG
jgi:hypothetical protein